MAWKSGDWVPILTSPTHCVILESNLTSLGPVSLMKMRGGFLNLKHLLGEKIVFLIVSFLSSWHPALTTIL